MILGFGSVSSIAVSSYPLLTGGPVPTGRRIFIENGMKFSRCCSQTQLQIILLLGIAFNNILEYNVTEVENLTVTQEVTI